jgi:4-hydroxy-tetrahydrodipicolinate synthase
MLQPVSGIIVATLTPFAASGRLCTSTVARHVEYLAAGGIPAIAPGGTTGEFLYLGDEERAELIRASVAAARGRLRVVAAIWSLRPEGVSRLAGVAQEAGADAVFLTTPIYYPASDATVLEWYRHARRHTALPLFAYHIPQYAANGVSAAVAQTLMEEGTIQGIKDSTGREERVRELLAVGAGRLSVYGASDSFALRARELGCTGFISALANIFPRAFARIWEGDSAAQQEVNRIRTAVKGYGGIGALKSLLRARGVDAGGTRLPFGNPSAEEERQLQALAATLD